MIFKSELLFRCECSKILFFLLPLMILQQNSTEKPACGNGKEKIQHGSKEGKHLLIFVHGDCVFMLCKLSGDELFPPPAGHCVSGGEWAAQTHFRGHCSVPLQRRGPQQDCYRRLPWREVLGLKISSALIFLSYRLFVTMLVLLLLCRDDFNFKVLQAFVDLHEFTDLNLVQALR